MKHGKIKASLNLGISSIGLGRTLGDDRVRKTVSDDFDPGTNSSLGIRVFIVSITTGQLTRQVDPYCAYSVISWCAIHGVDLFSRLGASRWQNVCVCVRVFFVFVVPGKPCQYIGFFVRMLTQTRGRWLGGCSFAGASLMFLPCMDAGVAVMQFSYRV